MAVDAHASTERICLHKGQLLMERAQEKPAAGRLGKAGKAHSVLELVLGKSKADSGGDAATELQLHGVRAV